MAAVIERVMEAIEEPEQVEADLTERKRVEEQLLLQSTALAAAANAIVITDTEGRIIWVNSAFCRLTGYTSEEVVGRNPRLVKSGVHDQAFYEHLWGTIYSGQVWSGEVTNRRKDGTLYTEEMTITPVHQRGVISHFIAIQQDITERKRTAEQLRQHALRLENLREIDRVILAQESAEDMARMALARLRQLIPCDCAAVTLFDLESRTAVRLAVDGAQGAALDATMQLDAFFPPKAFIQHPTRPVEDIAALQPQPPILEHLLAAGMHSVLTEALLAHGELLGVLNLFASRPGAFAPEHRDITREVAAQLAIAIQQTRLHRQLEQRAAELERRVAERTAELEAVNQELEAFSCSVSHALRAPLRGIDGFSKALLEDCAADLNPQGRSYLAKVRAATQGMEELIDDLLSLSRVTRSEMHRQPVDLSAVAQAVAAELQRTQPWRQVHFVIADGVLANGAPALLRVVLENLLGNAWKYTCRHPAARIEFGVTTPGREPTTYFVSDDGAGFDMVYADKLFGAFQRLHSITEFEGTGIGLATVQRIIHRHGGRVWAEGAVERGAAFYFTISPS